MTMEVDRAALIACPQILNIRVSDLTDPKQRTTKCHGENQMVLHTIQPWLSYGSRIMTATEVIQRCARTNYIRLCLWSWRVRNGARFSCAETIRCRQEDLGLTVQGTYCGTWISVLGPPTSHLFNSNSRHFSTVIAVIITKRALLPNDLRTVASISLHALYGRSSCCAFGHSTATCILSGVQNA